MFGALSAHYRKEEERRLAQLQQQRLMQKQQALMQPQRAAVVATANNNSLQPSSYGGGQYLSRTPEAPRSREQQPPYRSHSTVISPMQNRDLGRVMRAEQQIKSSRSDGSYPCSSSDEESDDEPPPPQPQKPRSRKLSGGEWKTASIKAKTVNQLAQPRRKKTYY